MTVGERIRQRREELGLTQMQLAYKMGYNTRSSISRTEQAGDDIGTNRIVKFAEALNVSPAYLMGWEDDKPPKTDYQIQLSDQETLLIEAFRSSDETTRKMIERLLLYAEKLYPTPQK